jgi:hypothetical protein
MSITVKLLHRILFDVELMRRIENVQDITQERTAIRTYLDSLPEVEASESDASA